MRRALVLLFCLAIAQLIPAQQLGSIERADSLQSRLEGVTPRAIQPFWLDGGHSFWYPAGPRNDYSDAYWVDARSGKKERVFDPAKLAKALSDKTGSPVAAGDLQLSFNGFQGDRLRFVALGKA